MSKEPVTIEGFKFVYKLQPGDKYAFFDDKIIVCNPNQIPKIIHTDGTIEELKCE